jgi:hypothetical protein
MLTQKARLLQVLSVIIGCRQIVIDLHPGLLLQKERVFTNQLLV